MSILSEIGTKVGAAIKSINSVLQTNIDNLNINNQHGVIFNNNGEWLIDKIYTETKNVSCVANVPVEVFNISTLQNVTYSTFLIDISWGGAFTAGTSTSIIWHGGVAGVFHLDVAESMYNSTPPMPLLLSGNIHHITIPVPTFTLDSNSNNGNYGNSVIMMTCTDTLDFSNLKLKIRRVM